MKHFQSFLGNCNIVFALVFLVLMILNQFNPAMLFLASGISKIFLLLFCLSSITMGVVTLVIDYRVEKMRLARERQRQHERARERQAEKRR